MNWYVYLLECADGTLYCGITTAPERRVTEHNGLLPGGAKYTRGRRPVRLIGLARCEGKSEAARLEARIKKTKRAFKQAVLHAGNTP